MQSFICKLMENICTHFWCLVIKLISDTERMISLLCHMGFVIAPPL